MLECGAEPSGAVSCPGDSDQELVAVLHIYACLGHGKSRGSRQSSQPCGSGCPSLLGLVPRRAATVLHAQKGNQWAWSCWFLIQKNCSSSQPSHCEEGHASLSYGKDCIWRSGTYPTGQCILVVLFWHCFYGGRLYFACCNDHYVWLRTISLPPDLFCLTSQRPVGDVLLSVYSL